MFLGTVCLRSLEWKFEFSLFRPGFGKKNFTFRNGLQTFANFSLGFQILHLCVLFYIRDCVCIVWLMFLGNVCMRFRKGNFEFSLLCPILSKNCIFYVFDRPLALTSLLLSFHVSVSEERSEGLKAYPPVDLCSRFRAFEVSGSCPTVSASLGTARRIAC